MISTKAIVGDFKEFIIDKDDPLELESLEGFINAHKNLVKERYEPLLNMYQGKHNILFDEPKPLNKPDNKVVMNFAKYIVDIFWVFLLKSTTKAKIISTSLLMLLIITILMMSSTS